VRKLLSNHIDHIVLTVSDIEKTTQFYEVALGFEREFFRGPEGQPRHALKFGKQKINLQDRTTDTPTKAQHPTFGSGDFCLIAAVPLDEVLNTPARGKNRDRSRTGGTARRSRRAAIYLLPRPGRKSHRGGRVRRGGLTILNSRHCPEPEKPGGTGTRASPEFVDRRNEPWRNRTSNLLIKSQSRKPARLLYFFG